VLHDGETVTLGQVLSTSICRCRVTRREAQPISLMASFTSEMLPTSQTAAKIQDPPWITSDNRVEDRAALVRVDQRLIEAGTDVKVIACSHSGVLTQGVAPLTAFRPGAFQLERLKIRSGCVRKTDNMAPS